MQNVSEIRHHIAAVGQTRKITNAMQMVSSARMRKFAVHIPYNNTCTPLHFTVSSSALIHRGHSGTAGGEHGIGYDDQSFSDRLRQLAVILVGHVGDRVSVKADMADPGRRHEREHTIYHAKTRSQHRYDRQFFSGDERRPTRLKKRR